MARPKNNPDYNPEKARDELIQAVVELYENPRSAEEADKNNKTKMKYMQQEFGLSMTKIRKLLVTGGVYEFWKDDIELVSEIAEMREEGLTDEQIREELSISVGTLSSLTPYRSGTYNADFTADGYDYSNVSTDARRKRSQRKREKMKEKDVLEERQKGIEEMKDHRTAMDRRKESEKSNLNQARENAKAWLKKYGFEDQFGVYQKVVEAISEGRIDVTDVPGVLEHSSDEQIAEMGKNPIPHILSYVMYLQSFIIPDEEEKEPKVKTLGAEMKGRYIHGKPMGDFIFLPGDDEHYRLPEGEIVTPKDATLTGFIDQNREKHVFVLGGWETGNQRIFTHREVFRVNKSGKRMAGQPNTEYDFSVSCTVDEFDEGVYKIIEKTAVALQNLTIKREVNRGGYALADDKYSYSTKNVGTIAVLDDYNGEVYFQIDGRRFEPEDVVKLFSAEVGGVMYYQIMDPTDDPLEEDMMLIPMRIDEDTLEQELNDLLFAMTEKHEGKFLRTEDVAAFDVLFGKIVDKLKAYFGGHPREYGKVAGERLIKVLKGIGTNDDMFPEYEIKMVRDAVTGDWEK